MLKKNKLIYILALITGFIVLYPLYNESLISYLLLIFSTCGFVKLLTTTKMILIKKSNIEGSKKSIPKEQVIENKQLVNNKEYINNNSYQVVKKRVRRLKK